MKERFWSAFVATTAAALGFLNYGFAIAFPSPVEKDIEKDLSWSQSSQFSWFVVSSYFIWFNFLGRAVTELSGLR